MKPAADYKKKLLDFLREIRLIEDITHGEVKIVFVNGGISRVERIETLK